MTTAKRRGERRHWPKGITELAPADFVARVAAIAQASHGDKDVKAFRVIRLALERVVFEAEVQHSELAMQIVALLHECVTGISPGFDIEDVLRPLVARLKPVIRSDDRAKAKRSDPKWWSDCIKHARALLESGRQPRELVSLCKARVGKSDDPVRKLLQREGLVPQQKRKNRA